MVVGIDVGQYELHCVALSPHGSLSGAAVIPASDSLTLRNFCRHATAVAIDAPSAASTEPHAHDEPPVLRAAKFRAGRCAEIALAREHRYWVSFVTPAVVPDGGWMAAGIAVYQTLARDGVETLEVFPHGCFLSLAGRLTLPKKASAEGKLTRLDLLARAGLDVTPYHAWTHDGRDAVVAALVALDFSCGSARRVTCGHDESAIWLPAVR